MSLDPLSIQGGRFSERSLSTQNILQQSSHVVPFQPALDQCSCFSFHHQVCPLFFSLSLLKLPPPHTYNMYLYMLLSLLLSHLTRAISIPNPPPPTTPLQSGKVCTVLAHGNQTDDTPQILSAFESCNNGGTVVFPASENYWIATRLNPILQDVSVEWAGVWTFSDNLTYWRENGYPVAFQNHHAGFIITGDRIHINGARADGNGTGGIFGNGNAWYNAEHNVTQPGRAFPFVFWNVSHVKVEHFFVKDPALWSLNIMNGTDMWFDDITNNATALDAPFGTNWVKNTDGFDTMDAYNIRLTNMVYQGGDDCIAIKPRSYNIVVQNITCHGGNGIAIGSLGQYLEDSSVANIIVRDVTLLPHNDYLSNAAYIKTWIGVPTNQSSYESAGVPRGGGWGVVENITFDGFRVLGANIGPDITQTSGDTTPATHAGTSKMLVQNIIFSNWIGWVRPNGPGYVQGGVEPNTTASISCSTVYPCRSIIMQNVKLSYGENGTVIPEPVGTCRYVADGGVLGMEGQGCG